LTGLLQDSDAAVRQAASRSLSSILGTDVSSVVSLDDAQRRREIRRLAQMPANPVTAARERGPQPTNGTPSADAPLTPAPARPTAGGSAPVPPPSADEALCAAVLGELRINIRGRVAADLARVLGAPLARVDDACALLCARGQAVRRGLKYFVA
jgi:hypothetical protein